MTSGTWIDDWWAGRIGELREARLDAEGADPGVPAWYWTSADGTISPGPVSFVAAALNRLPKLLNLDRLHRRVLELYARPKPEQEARELAQTEAIGPRE